MKICTNCIMTLDDDAEVCTDCGSSDVISYEDYLLNQQINHDDDIKEDEELFNE